MDAFEERSGERIICTLCPHECRLSTGQRGLCGVRENDGSHIRLLTYGTISALNTDPIEKKPLYHFYPGSLILSAGSYGCNMKCDFCQNYSISQYIPKDISHDVLPETLVAKAAGIRDNAGIAFTYNEPSIWFEYVRDTAMLAKRTGLKTVIVSNGYMNPLPMAEMTRFIDAFNIDLKSFSPVFYRKLTGARLEPVLEAIKVISGAGKHLELTTLIIPGQNDDEDELARECEWIASETGRQTPLHLSRYFPMNRRSDPATDPQSLLKLRKSAMKHLDYVYIGNIPGPEGQDTICQSCGTVVTRRQGYDIYNLSIDDKGCCKVCGKLIFSNFTLKLT